jgi:hypothetical protein
MWGHWSITDRINTARPRSEGGRDSKKSVDWSDNDAILLGESIGKAIVSLQIPEVLNDEAIQVLLCKKFDSAKQLYHFKPQNFQGEAIQVLLRQKMLIVKAIVSFQTPEFFQMKRYKYFYTKKFESTKRLYRFEPQKLLAMKRYNYFCYFYLKRLYERLISVGGWGDSQI